MSNVFGSFFSCFPNAASLSRSMVLESANGRTQLSAIFSSLIVLVVIVWIGPLFEPLPTACLASIIVVALKNLLLQVRVMFALWRIKKYVFISWLATYLSVVFLDVDIGLVIGILASILSVVVRDMLLKFSDSTLSIQSNSMTPTNNIRLDSDLMKSVKIIDVQNSIYFVNCEKFVQRVTKTLERSSTKDQDSTSRLSEDIEYTNETKIQYLVLDLSAVNYVDTNGMKSMQQLLEDTKKTEIKMYLVNPQDTFISIAYKMNILDKFDSCIFKSLDDALSAIMEKEYSKDTVHF